MPNTVRLHRVLAMASPDRMTAISDWLSGRCWAELRRTGKKILGQLRSLPAAGQQINQRIEQRAHGR